ncbi:MAG: peptidyl-prolyl cis-trans isomerase [Prosthecobacter sp.]|uniref:peptidylprolyl isomerase n=1 Tax=Prosthecobacter sp. TaxID=1965333 RepID=UPI0025FEC457|nr:peptidyl-prolyl cis-trans isomerase [Prosthecobacter sp.]MCF7788379.1 peptidyl-prolyl cis-trans isomerase [Prosthecobacter sp.]
MKSLSSLLPPVCACCAWLLMTLAGGGDACAQAPQEETQNRMVAKVNGAPILVSDLKQVAAAQAQVIRQQFADDPTKLEKEMAAVKLNALDTLIDCQLLADEFYKLGGVMQPEFLEQDLTQIIQMAFRGNREAFMADLAKNGMALEKFRELRERMIIMNVMRARIAGTVKVTEEEVREHYEKNLRRWSGPEMVKLHTVTISKTTADARSVAESVHTKLVAGGDFAEIARKSSADSHAARGGEWKWIYLSDLTGTVSEVVLSTKKGEISEVIEQLDAYIIVRVDDRQEGEPKPFESVKAEVAKSLMEEVSKERIEKRLIQLRAAADIQRMGAE